MCVMKALDAPEVKFGEQSLGLTIRVQASGGSSARNDGLVVVGSPSVAEAQEAPS